MQLISIDADVGAQRLKRRLGGGIAEAGISPLEELGAWGSRQSGRRQGGSFGRGVWFIEAIKSTHALG